MASLTDIRAALAANLAVLRTNETVAHVSAYMLEHPMPGTLQVAGVAPDGIDYDSGGLGSDPDVTWRLIIEAVLGPTGDVGAQQLLNKLLATTGSTSLKAAVEADPTLTQRLNEATGRVTTGQTALANWARVTRYRGQARHTFAMSGVETLVASWEVEVDA